MLPTGLSMLWESVDPEVALVERFGFGSLDEVADWVSTSLDRVWGITVAECPRMVISDHNAIVWTVTDRGGLVVKWSRASERFAHLEAATGLLRAVGQQGIPVAVPLATLDGDDRVVLPGPSAPLSLALLPELEGDWLDVDDLVAVEAAGAMFARLHEALRVSSQVGLAPAPRAGLLREQITSWLADGDRGLAPDASARLATLVAEAPVLDDVPQTVHQDFRAANLLTRDSAIVGVLDFDDAAVGHRVADLARSCTYLGTRFTDWRPTPPAARRALRVGYEKVRPLSPAETSWLDVLTVWYGIAAIPGADDPAGWADAVRPHP